MTRQPAHSYDSEINERALARARRRLQAEPEPEYDDDRWPLWARGVTVVVGALGIWVFVALLLILGTAP